jgi:hypothetical protein
LYHALLERASKIGDESLMPATPSEYVAVPRPARTQPLVQTGFGPAAPPMPSNWPDTQLSPVPTVGAVTSVTGVAPVPTTWPWETTPAKETQD